MAAEFLRGREEACWNVSCVGFGRGQEGAKEGGVCVSLRLRVCERKFSMSTTDRVRCFWCILFVWNVTVCLRRSVSVVFFVASRSRSSRIVSCRALFCVCVVSLFPRSSDDEDEKAEGLGDLDSSSRSVSIDNPCGTEVGVFLASVHRNGWSF